MLRRKTLPLVEDTPHTYVPLSLSKGTGNRETWGEMGQYVPPAALVVGIWPVSAFTTRKALLANLPSPYLRNCPKPCFLPYGPQG